MNTYFSHIILTTLIVSNRPLFQTIAANEVLQDRSADKLFFFFEYFILKFVSYRTVQFIPTDKVTQIEIVTDK